MNRGRLVTYSLLNSPKKMKCLNNLIMSRQDEIKSNNNVLSIKLHLKQSLSRIALFHYYNIYSNSFANSY